MTACPGCGFILENSAEVTNYRRVTFEACPKCGRRLIPAPTVTALGVDEDDVESIPPTVIKRLED